MEVLIVYMSNSFFGRVADNRIILENDGWRTILSKYEDQEIQLTIEKRFKKRTKKQNDYLWGAIYKTISLHTGYTEMELHRIFGAMFLTYQLEFNKKLITRIKSTTELSTEELADYIRSIAIEVASMEITLPTRDEWDTVNI